MMAEVKSDAKLESTIHRRREATGVLTPHGLKDPTTVE